MVTKQRAKEIYNSFISGLNDVLHVKDAVIYMTGSYFWIKFDDDTNYFNIDPESLELDYFCYEGRFDDFHNNLMDCRDYIRRHRRDFDSIIWCFKHEDKLVEEDTEKNEECISSC